jgi:hypothetical protein
LPLPGSLRGGAAAKVVAALRARPLICEEVTESHAKADAALNTLWRTLEDRRGVLLRITAAGLEAIGIEPQVAEELVAPQQPGGGRTDSPASGEPRSAGAPQGPSASRTAPQQGKTREGTKQVALVAMLQRPEGATIAEVVEATGWQPHTVRGALAGALRKRLGLTIVSEKLEGRGRVYRLG